MNKIVKVVIDRPLGSSHPNHKDIYYFVNYGYLPGIIAPDGEEQDVYVLGINEPDDRVFQMLKVYVSLMQHKKCSLKIE